MRTSWRRLIDKLSREAHWVSESLDEIEALEEREEIKEEERRQDEGKLMPA